MERKIYIAGNDVVGKVIVSTWNEAKMICNRQPGGFNYKLEGSEDEIINKLKQYYGDNLSVFKALPSWLMHLREPL
jgi:hypothetical protein